MICKKKCNSSATLSKIFLALAGRLYGQLCLKISRILALSLWVCEEILDMANIILVANCESFSNQNKNDSILRTSLNSLFLKKNSLLFIFKHVKTPSLFVLATLTQIYLGWFTSWHDRAQTERGSFVFAAAPAPLRRLLQPRDSEERSVLVLTTMN